MKAKKIFWIILGCVSLALGAIGAALPILPTVPFLLLAAFSFAKSSKRLHNWFINTKLYKKNLASYVKGKGMTWPAKIKFTAPSLAWGITTASPRRSFSVTSWKTPAGTPNTLRIRPKLLRAVWKLCSTFKP